MRLSLMKAAHVALVSASSRKSGSPVFINPRTLVRTCGTRSELVRVEEWFIRTPFRVGASGRVVYQDTLSELVRAEEWITRTLAPGGRQQRLPPVPGLGGNDLVHR
jgi:hypothetical protein